MFDLTRIRFSLKQLLGAMTLAAILIFVINTWVLGLMVVQVALPTIIGFVVRVFRGLLPNHMLSWVAVGMLLASIFALWIFMVNQYGLTEEIVVIHVCYLLVFWIPQLVLMNALVGRPT